jgi:hypothetical protein
MTEMEELLSRAQRTAGQWLYSRYAGGLCFSPAELRAENS